VKRDRIATLLIALLIVAAVVAFVWWRSTKSLMSEGRYRDGVSAMVVAIGS
jgi:uncharacterized membrane protein YidH (DUF202 family)